MQIRPVFPGPVTYADLPYKDVYIDICTSYTHQHPPYSCSYSNVYSTYCKDTHPITHLQTHTRRYMAPTCIHTHLHPQHIHTPTISLPHHIPRHMAMHTHIIAAFTHNYGYMLRHAYVCSTSAWFLWINIQEHMKSLQLATI